MSWQEQFRHQGYAHFKGLTPEPLVSAAQKSIAYDLTNNYDPASQSEYDNRSYCPGLKRTPAIMNLFLKSPVLEILGETFGIEEIDWDGGQIAIRQAYNHSEPVPPVAHLDGFSTGLNGLEEGKIYNHTILVGVFLTPLRKPFAGNFTVWPASHYVYERYFRERGPGAMKEPMPTLELGEPVQLNCEVGDVVLAHYQLGHSAAVNTSDQDRIAVYFRVWLKRVGSDRWHYLTNIWEGWTL